MIVTLLQSAASGDRARVSPTALGVRLMADWRGLDRALLRVDPAGETEIHSSLRYGDHELVWSDVPRTADGDGIEAVCHGSRLWPAQEPPPSDWVRRTVVTATGEGGSDRIGAARLLTRAVASMIALDDTVLAVDWTPARHVALPAAVRAIAGEDDLASYLHLWAACNVSHDPGGRLTGHTVGLDALGLMDVEIPTTDRSPEETLEQLRGLAHYQLLHGSVIADGDTIGRTEQERILVRHAPSAFDPAVTVLQPEVGRKRRGLFRRG